MTRGLPTWMRRHSETSARGEKRERRRARKVKVANYASDVWVPRGARQMQIMPTNFSENSRIRREREADRIFAARDTSGHNSVVIKPNGRINYTPVSLVVQNS